jgi:fused signal recognition particle receptor
MGLFDTLKKGLAKTKELMFTDVRDLLRSGRLVNDAFLDELEAKLIRTDMGVKAATGIVDDVRERYSNRVVEPDELIGRLKNDLKALLTQDDAPIRFAERGTTVLMIAGVNGSGKTTSIAKLAKRFRDQGKTVLLAAGDTFRAAAVEQLGIWSQRLGCELIKAEAGTDPASVAHDACDAARARNIDVLIVDTAGRLQTQRNLMAELSKIHRVVARQVPGAPHEVLLVLDATTGQNGISQAKHFTDAIQCTGIILAKLDGTAKGGVVVAIKQEIQLPVKFVGVGEKAEDLVTFDAGAFVDALFD